jgi:hypothetical protein
MTAFALLGGGDFRRRFAVLFCRFAGLFESAGGVFVGLTGQLMGGEAALAVRGCRGGVGMCGKVVVLGGSVVGALWHLISPLAG